MRGDDGFVMDDNLQFFEFDTVVVDPRAFIV